MNGRLIWWLLGLFAVLLTAGGVGMARTITEHTERIARQEAVMPLVIEELREINRKLDRVLDERRWRSGLGG